MFRWLAAIVLVGLSALASSLLAQGDTKTDAPAGVVRVLLAAMAANDATGIRAVFAASATQAYGNGAPKIGEAFSRWLQSDIIDRHGQVTDARIDVQGTDVVVTGQYRNNAGYSSPANFLFKVSDGRIVSWQMRY